MSCFFKRIRRYVLPGTSAPLAKNNDHDLWSRLHTLIQRAVAMGCYQNVIKVTSHQQPSLTDTVEEWARQSNDCAVTEQHPEGSSTFRIQF